MKNRRGLTRELIETAILTILIFAGVRAGFQNFRVQGTSMTPTLHTGDFVLVSKVDYLLHSPQRGDVVVFRFPLDPTQDYIKRIIGVPGDTVSVANGSTYVNGHAIPEGYIAQRPGYTYPATRVPNGDYFVLGDNRNASYDSHAWGMLPRANIIGKAVFSYWPPGDARIFSALLRIAGH